MLYEVITDILSTISGAALIKEVKAEAEHLFKVYEQIVVDYNEAKNEQARVEAEIINIEKMLRNAVVVDEGKVDLHKVNVGTVVRNNFV